MATVHVYTAQDLFLAKQMIPYAVGIRVYTLSNECNSVHDYMRIHQLAFKNIGDYTELQMDFNSTKFFSAKLPTVLICQTFYCQSFLLYGVLKLTWYFCVIVLC